MAKPEKLVNGIDLLEWLDNNVKSQPTFSDVTKGINDLPDASEPLREAAKPGLIALMSEMSEDRWCAGWLTGLRNELLKAEPGNYSAGPRRGADLPEQTDFDRLVLALGEAPEWLDGGLHWSPLTAEERAMVEKRLKEGESA